MSILNALHSAEKMFSVLQKDHPFPDGGVGLVPHIKHIRDNAAEMELIMSVQQADRMLREIRSDGEYLVSRLIESFRDLSRRIQDELNNAMLFMVPRVRADYYDQAEPLGGSKIVGKLPNVAYDAAEAGNCFAVGRYTACVFHLMRVMEACVKDLGAKFGLQSAANGAWGLIESNLTDAVKKAYPNKHSRDYQTYMRILAYLGAVRAAWRNNTMHPKSTYTEEDAKRIMEAVRIFTDDLADVL